jgi:hypothetical protein
LVAHNCWRRIVRTGFIQQERGGPHFVGGDYNNPDLRASREIADAYSSRNVVLRISGEESAAEVNASTMGQIIERRRQATFRSRGRK